MNQTNWIVGGGVVIVAAALWLYTMSGDGLPKAAPIKTAQKTEATQTPPAPQTENFATHTPPKPITTTMTQPEKTETTPTKTETTTTASSVILHTSMGNIAVKLYADAAPKAVENFIKLSKSGFYDGVKFHRVIKGFMIQGGDPLSKDDAMVAKWGTGGPGYQFADEINKSSAIYQKGYKHGVLAMANSGPNTNGSQFFIMAADYPLPPLYVIFGEVTTGLDVVDVIDAVATDRNDRPLTAVVVTKAEVK